MQTILFVSAHEFSREFLPGLFAAKFPVSVVTAAQCGEALQKLSEVPIDCVITEDVVDGASVFEFMKTVRSRCEVPILLLHGADLDEAQHAKSSGATAYVQLPAIDEIFTSLRNLMDFQ